jgi:hypothetical protein
LKPTRDGPISLLAAESIFERAGLVPRDESAPKQKVRQNKRRELSSDSIGTEKL